MQRVRHQRLSMEFEDSFGVLNGKRDDSINEKFAMSTHAKMIVTTFTLGSNWCIAYRLNVIIKKNF